MRLRHIVPTLGLVVTAVSAQAVETAPGLTIGGFVDTVLGVNVAPGYNSDADANVRFGAEVELQVGYAISDVVQLQTDIEFMTVTDNRNFTSTPEGGDVNDYNVEQAYVAWGVSDKVTLMMGKWEGLIGYEAWDAPDLYRVNTSPVFDLNGVRPVGLDVNIKANDQFSADIYLVNGVFVDEQAVTDDLGIGSTGLGFGLSLTYATDVALIDFDLGIDPEGQDGGGDNEAILGVNLSGEYTGMEGLTVFGDFAFRDFDAGSVMGIMAGANYGINEKMSGTLMVTFIDDEDDIDGFAAEELEVALALLTMPTSDQNFGLNFELQFLVPEDSDADSQVGFYVEMLGIIP